MGAARGRGLEPDDFAALAQRNDQQVGPPRQTSSRVPRRFSTCGALDYSGSSIGRALAQADPSLRGRYRAIYVDEFRDTDRSGRPAGFVRHADHGAGRRR